MAYLQRYMSCYLDINTAILCLVHFVQPQIFWESFPSISH